MKFLERLSYKILDWIFGPDPEDEVCEYCGGTGEISTDESDGEGHIQRGVGTRRCICQIKDDEEDEA